MNDTDTKINKGKGNIPDTHTVFDDINNGSIGRYKDIKLIGQGGMARVYKAYDPILDRYIAIKLLRKGVASVVKAEKRFRQEIKHQSKLNIPGCVKIFDCGEYHRQLYCVMEFIEGNSLDKLIRKKQFNLQEKLDILLRISKIIKELHSVKLEHRDIKPANIMINSHGRVFLLDFGLSKAMEAGKNIYNTIYGDFFGTPAYMSPEQTDTKVLPLTKHRADVYALGMTAYELLTGCLPFELEHLEHDEILYVIQNGKPKQPGTLNSEIPDKLDELILKSISKNPNDRPTSSEFYNKLKAVIERNKIKKNKMRRVYLFLAYTAIIIVISGTVIYGYSGIKKHNEPKQIISSVPLKSQIITFQTEKKIIPSDLLISRAATFTSTKHMASGSSEALLKQKNFAKKNNLPVEVETSKYNIKLRLIPPGNFIKGSPSREYGRNDNENRKEVTIKKPFYIGIYEITEKEWKEVIGNDHDIEVTADGEIPVTGISWDDCQVFLKKLCKELRVPKNTYRLPTEEEWEYASRAGTSTPFYFGKKLSASSANFDGTYKYGNVSKSEFRGKPTPVGSFKSNAFGLYDTVGNVWEWCSDKYYIKVNSAKKDTKKINVNVFRIMRGGSWLDKGVLCRSSSKEEHEQSSRSSIWGFRIVRNAFK